MLDSIEQIRERAEVMMPASSLLEYDASDVDARLNAGVAVLALVTDQGRVAISMTPAVLERLGLLIQLELARQMHPSTRSVEFPTPEEELLQTG